MRSDIKEKLKKLQTELSAIPELPEEPHKDLARKLEDIADELTQFKERRARLNGKAITRFDRMYFESVRGRLARELENLKREAIGA